MYKMEKAPFLGNPRRTSTDSNWDNAFAGRQKGSARRKRFTSYAVFALGVIVLLVILYKFTVTSSGGFALNATSSVHNSTLGFGAVVLLSLPERTDRQDAVSLIASRSGIQITKQIDAVHGEDIHYKARPFGKANSTIMDGYIGSWRTHMNALKYVVDQRLETALIIEDDVDWDVRIKPQLESFSKGLKASILRDPNSITVDHQHPYGNDWDIMHLGAVIVFKGPAPYDRLNASYVDPDRPKDPGCLDPYYGMFCYSRILDYYAAANNSRIILPSYFATGLPAIAVTFEGASRILYELALKQLDNTLDYSIEGLLWKGHVKGWTVVPPLFGMWGNTEDSDLFGESKVRAPIEGFSAGIERSARQALNDQYNVTSTNSSRWTTDYWGGRGIDLELTKPNSTVATTLPKESLEPWLEPVESSNSLAGVAPTQSTASITSAETEGPSISTEIVDTLPLSDNDDLMVSKEDGIETPPP